MMYRWLELVSLFGVLPVIYATGLVPIHVLALLLLLTAACLVVLWRDGSFDRRQLWDGRRLGSELRRVAALLVVNAVLLAIGLALFAPYLAFNFVRRAPVVWALVMVLYPLVSVYPQEVVYRAFFFHRYRRLLPGRLAMMAANAVAFAWMHIVFDNWVAVILTLVGGALFAWTFERTRSTLVVAVEHALYGGYVFTIGLGGFFYHGSLG